MAIHPRAPRRRHLYAWIIGGEAVGLIVVLGMAAMLLRDFVAPAQPMSLATAVQLGPSPTTHSWATWTPPPRTVTPSPTATHVRTVSAALPSATVVPRAIVPRVGWQTGAQAPDFSLADLQGNSVRLSGLRGKVVVLNFWATWCPPCRDELPDLESFYADYESRGVIVLGINHRESADPARELRDSRKLTFPILLDHDGSVSNQLHVDALPCTVFVDRSGVIRSILKGQGTRQRFAERVGPLL